MASLDIHASTHRTRTTIVEVLATIGTAILFILTAPIILCLIVYWWLNGDFEEI